MIKILFFAQFQEAIGKDKLEIDLAGQSIKQIKTHLKENYELQGLEHAMTAINEEFADEATIIKDGDTIAFIPPVSGG